MKAAGLYDPSFEHDACGVGFVAHIHGVASNRNVSDALTILENMEHRGACGCEDNTGDGAGILVAMPHAFMDAEATAMGFRLPPAGKYAVGALFFPADLRLREACRRELNATAAALGLPVLGYRQVPVNAVDIGETALSVAPEIEQIFVACPEGIGDTLAFERKLFVLRNAASHRIAGLVADDPIGFYIPSLSSRTLVYKGQLTTGQVRSYYPDLSHPLFESPFGLVHSRFATNTFPSWKLAHPYRYIAHNGEINTLQGNLNWLRSSEKGFVSPYFSAEEMAMLLPVVSGLQSDSACLDNMIELLTLTGRSLPHVLMMLIPEAWHDNPDMSAERRDFYEYHAALMEPWDGPANIVFTDGNLIGATLDRNGLRPSRYCITEDDRVILASETGVLPIDPATIRERGRLQPGRMFVVDMAAGRIIADEELKKGICAQQPYGDWLNRYKIRIEELPAPRVTFSPLHADQVRKYQRAFGYSREDVDEVVLTMALDGKEPTGSMGTNAPLAVLSRHAQHLSSYFKQLFAQVTNPPIDPIRERLVMSLVTFVGNNGNLLNEDPLSCHTVVLPHPILADHELEKLRSIDTGIFQAKTLQCYFFRSGKEGDLQRGLERLCRYATDAVEEGFEVIILSDRAIDSDHAAIPTLLAVSAVHHHLVRKGYRGQVGIVVEAGDAWEVHHYACLLGFGATAINPYLAFATIRDGQERGRIDAAADTKTLYKNYTKAVNDGLLKVFSKMGISTLQSYQGAQIFEIVGLHRSVVDPYFTGAVSRIGGLHLQEIAQEILIRHDRAFGKGTNGDLLPSGGVYSWRRDGEAHLFNPATVHLLQLAAAHNDYNIYKKYCAAVNAQEEKAVTLRSLLEFASSRLPVPIGEVEPVEVILKRFATGAMSFGSISHEAHSTLAIAMNRIGAKSNTGEGGEDESRYTPLPNGDSMRSAIKQVASARFGVTIRYLTEADEIQIKMAQGAKPGEGGQLPGHKVDEWIGRVRHATPGVGLISPPPHHDIYSIEDLAQLIFDLKNANRAARINVKLVSKAGVGTIAAGVAKAKADVILIAGHDGGTGASPLSSIRHAGLPWELGLAETHQTLVRNGLRNRVVLQTDGQLKTARDLAIATLLGAEEWGIATAALVVQGCIMMRKCHLNTCPVGVATQDETLRKRFAGNPDHVVNFFRMLAEELREIMASLGFRTVNEMVGQSDLLRQRQGLDFWKWKGLDLSPLLYKPEAHGVAVHQTLTQDHNLRDILDWQLLEAAQPAMEAGAAVHAAFPISNRDRTTGTLLSNEIAKRFGSAALPDESIHFHFRGTAGQSFGAFLAPGVTLRLEGDCNDYFGKGLSGGKLILYPDAAARFVADQNIIVGNVCFYGATSGEGFIRGKAGERFAVRNSGASVVVEGVGDHGCEYMTGGRVVILGATGRNFGAGMSGGIAYVYDVQGRLAQNCNRDGLDLEPVGDGAEELRELLEKHAFCTGSAVARFILDDFQHQLRQFVRVYPKEYKRAVHQRRLAPASTDKAQG